MELDNGSAIVTGAAGGIGSAIAAALAGRGMAVVMADIDAARLEAEATRIGGSHPDARVLAVQGDVGDADHHRELVEAASAEAPLRLSVLNAGVSVPGLSWEMPLEQWELTTRVNYWGVVHGLRAALASMVPGGEGWVVAVSSGAGLVATPGLAPYVATKHAVVGLMESTHHELARVGSAVGVSVVCPGNIATDMPQRHGTAQHSPDSSGVVDGLEAVITAGVAEGASPQTVVDALVDGVLEERFWVLPQPELAWAATDRTSRISKGDPPVDLLG